MFPIYLILNVAQVTETLVFCFCSTFLTRNAMYPVLLLKQLKYNLKKKINECREVNIQVLKKYMKSKLLIPNIKAHVRSLNPRKYSFAKKTTIQS